MIRAWLRALAADWLGIIIGVLLLILVLMFFPSARAHDIYRSWTIPSNPAVSCCHDHDCRPTRAYLGEDGLWRAWNGIVWLTVPPSAMLPSDVAGDGRNHLCEQSGLIYCFSPTGPKG